MPAFERARIKTDTVVPDTDAHGSIDPGEFDDRFGRPRVLAHVRQCFLDDPQELEFRDRLKVAECLVVRLDHEPGCDIALLLPTLEIAPQCIGKTPVRSQARPEPQDPLTHVRIGVTSGSLELLQVSFDIRESFRLTQEFTHSGHFGDHIPENLSETIVHLASDPLALLADRQPHQPAMQARIGDRERSLGRESLQSRPVLLVERQAVFPIGQVEATENAFLRPDRYSEQALHRWMPLGIPTDTGIPLEILDIERTVLAQDELQDPVLAHRALGTLGRSWVPGREERPVPVLVLQDQQPVAGSDESPGLVDHPLQDNSEVEFGRDRQASLVQRDEFGVLREQLAMKVPDQTEDPVREGDDTSDSEDTAHAPSPRGAEERNESVAEKHEQGEESQRQDDTEPLQPVKRAFELDGRIRKAYSRHRASQSYPIHQDTTVGIGFGLALTMRRMLEQLLGARTASSGAVDLYLTAPCNGV
ncbi:hypothetical protein HRbin27_01451 [bacterium HR27]|nr:hypothetical protein HRbin27_01451 [bacterium HR27]